MGFSIVPPAAIKGDFGGYRELASGEVGIVITCDFHECDNKHRMIYNIIVTEKEIERQLKLVGWSIVGGKFVCPICFSKNYVMLETARLTIPELQLKSRTGD